MTKKKKSTTGNLIGTGDDVKATPAITRITAFGPKTTYAHGKNGELFLIVGKKLYIITLA